MRHQLTSYRVPADSKMEEKLCVGLNPVDYCKSSFVSVAKSFNINKDTCDAETMSAIARTKSISPCEMTALPYPPLKVPRCWNPLYVKSQQI